mmetsp:Transcript_55175/g.129133  ORF Transcript_55175/g.129133 Transcript_55175/m.129133 type:complete len:221 (-) Transcript_55175:781-1443(-)
MAAEARPDTPPAGVSSAVMPTETISVDFRLIHPPFAPDHSSVATKSWISLGSPLLSLRTRRCRRVSSASDSAAPPALCCCTSVCTIAHASFPESPPTVNRRVRQPSAPIRFSRAGRSLVLETTMTWAAEVSWETEAASRKSSSNRRMYPASELAVPSASAMSAWSSTRRGRRSSLWSWFGVMRKADMLCDALKGMRGPVQVEPRMARRRWVRYSEKNSSL